MIFTISNNKNTPIVPTGLGMALSQNVDALNYFGALSEDEQKKVINHAKNVQSKNELQDYVNNFNKYF